MLFMENKDVSFARKYRPNSLRGYIGNESVKSSVRKYFKNGRPQSILLTGHSGCGKTTLARIIMKSYMCENPTSDGDACCECMTCKMFDEYIATGNRENLMDLYEIDSSDKSGKKDIDSLLAGMEYPPMAGKWKGYIVDEVHLLSEGAMGRLLKTLEEPPEGVVLIFCTTNPEKLLDTVRNRCQLKLNITKPKTKDIVELLEMVCLNEGKEYNIAGLRMIANRSENVVRDALNNVERVINTRGNATDKAVSEEFNEISDTLIFDFYKSYLEKDYLAYTGILYKIKTTYTFEQFLISLTNFTVRGIYTLNGVDVEGLSEEELKSFMHLFKKMSPREISHVLKSLRQMSVGNIEANLMYFIYADINESSGGDAEVPKAMQGDSSKEQERSYRNNNLQAIEQRRLENGVTSLHSEMKPMSFEDFGELFSLTKVDPQ